MPLATLTPEQRRQALAKAAAARTARKHLLDEVKARKLSLADVLESAERDGLMQKTKILALVKALPGVGVVRAAQLLKNARVDPARRVGGLGTRQRQTLIDGYTGR